MTPFSAGWKTTLACASFGVFALAASGAVQAGYSSTIAFGDSLSDTGNILRITNGTYPPAPYWQGRFSDGPVAVEVLAQRLGTPLMNFAFGGATSGGTNAANGSPGVQQQLQMFKAALNGMAADPNALYVVWAGGNDIRYGGASVATKDAAVANLTAAVETLYGLGAREFLLPLLPDLGLTPESRALGAAMAGALSGYTKWFNANVEAAYQALSTKWSDETFHIVDTFDIHHDLLKNAAALGFTNTVDACLTQVSLCSAPGSYVYWDDVHPTAAAHRMIGAAFANAVPEPSTWALLSFAVVGLAASSRRRRGASTAA